MAFAKAKEVKEAQPFSKYLGAVVASLVAVNPTAEELAKITGRDIKVSDYVSDVEVVDLNNNKKQGKQNAITLWFSIPNPKKGEGEPEFIFINHRIYLSNSCRIGSQSGKIQVIDKWGRTAWATKSEYDSKSIPMYKTGPAQISPSYRAALVGEEDLVTAMKAFLGMNNPSERIGDNTYRPLSESELEERADEFACYIEPDDIKAIMSGNVKCIKSALEGCNPVKLILGVKHGENGDYQAVYHTIYKSNFNKLSKVEDEIKEANSQTTEYFVDEHIPNGLVEYSVSPTKMTKNKGSEDMEKPVDDLPF